MSALTRLNDALGKKRISIDQNCLSNMAKGVGDSPKLLAALRKTCSDGKIICPIHLKESIYESAALPPGFRKQVFALQIELSDRFAFYDFADHVCFKTKELIHGKFLYPLIWESRTQLTEGHDFAEIAKEFAIAKEDYNHRVAQKTNYPPPSFSKGMKGAKVYLGVAGDRAYSLWRILESLRDKGTLTTDREELELAVIVGGFLAAIRISPEDCNRLIHCIKHHQWETIEYLYIHARLGAQLELQCLSGHRDMNLNDQVDLTRLAVGLNDADIVLCDTAMAGVVRQSKVLDILKGVKVYSIKEQVEAADFIERL